MNEIIRIIMIFLCDVALTIFQIYCWNKLSKNDSDNINSKKYKVIAVIIIALLIYTSSYIFAKIFRMLISFLVLITICYFMICRNLKKSFILVMISQAIMWIAEFGIAIIISIIFKGQVDLSDENTGLFLIFNVLLITMCFMILKTNLPCKIYNKIIENGKSNKLKREELNYFVGIMLLMIISLIESYISLPFWFVAITNILMTIVFSFILLKITRVEDKYDSVNKKYRTSINGLKEYEEMIDKYRVVNHENKNTLLEIRGMLIHKDHKDKIIKKIDDIIDNKIKDNEKIMHKTAKIPEGGLRAIIYAKMCVMDDLKIKYKLDIANDVRTVDLIDLDENVIINICKILGVFTDNAIEEVKKLRKKNIGIEMYVIDNILSIDISNNYKGRIDIDKIDNAGYTTKGKGHGYGLALVNKIIDENQDILENERMIDKNTFTQSLKIKLKQE